MAPAKLTLDEVAADAAKMGCRCLLLNEESSPPHFALFLPPVTTTEVASKELASVVTGMAAVFDVHVDTDKDGNRSYSILQNTRPSLVQLPAYPTHPHVSAYGLYSTSFCSGTNRELLDQAVVSGSMVATIGAAILTVANYSARDSYRRAINILPKNDDNGPCWCIGGSHLCTGCTTDKWRVSPTRYIKQGMVVDCESCGSVVSSSLFVVNGKNYCDECATVVDGVPSLKKDCVQAAVYGGSIYTHAEKAVRCSVCAKDGTKDGYVTKQYAGICPKVDCGARASIKAQTQKE